MDATNSDNRMKDQNPNTHAPENPLYVLLFNLILPILILNQGSKHLGTLIPGGSAMGSKIALILAISAPLGYGIYSYRRSHKPNFISVVGLLNVLVTGSFALLHLEGGWFWLKEAAFPWFIGIAIAILNHKGEPFLLSLFWKENIFRVQKIEEILATRATDPQSARNKLFKKASDYFSFSFFLSGAGNFLLARNIFLPIDSTLDAQAHAQVLNAQIARMTWQAYTMIAVPMMVFMGVVLWYLLRELRTMTGLTTEDLLAS